MPFGFFKNNSNEERKYDLKSLMSTFNLNSAKGYNNQKKYDPSVGTLFNAMFNVGCKLIDPTYTYIDPILYFKLSDFMGDDQIKYYVYRSFDSMQNKNKLSSMLNDLSIPPENNQYIEYAYCPHVNKNASNKDVKSIINVILFENGIMFSQGVGRVAERIKYPPKSELIGVISYDLFIASIFSEEDIIMYNYINGEHNSKLAELFKYKRKK